MATTQRLVKDVAAEIDKVAVPPQWSEGSYVDGLNTKKSDNNILDDGNDFRLSKRHKRVLLSVFSNPISGTIKWSDIEALFKALDATVEEREGSRVAVILNGKVAVFHRPHPSPDTDKGAVKSVRKFLDDVGVKP
ncbi:type II toxin-antitoxin system HicA family toxin [Aeromonas hydrophila]|uniref:type II toxin-antitoxin system HicA family toxin n=1 Tax=Aeromonas hydrophila TaxID=644 RepID=UPI003987574D